MGKTRLVNKTLAISGILALANQAFLGAIRVIDQISRVQTAMSLKPYIDVLSNPIAILASLGGGLALVWYALKREHDRDIEEAPRVLVPWQRAPEKPPIKWFWLGVTAVSLLVAAAGAVFFHFIYRRSVLESPAKVIATIKNPPVSPSRTVEPRATPQRTKPRPSATLPAQPVAAPPTPTSQKPTGPSEALAQSSDPDRINVTGLVPQDAKRLAFVDSKQIDASTKPPNTAFVVVLVSSITREKGALDLDTIQRAYNTVTSTPGVQAFFGNAGYTLYRGNNKTQFSGSLQGLVPSPGEICLFNSNFSSLAVRIQQELSGIVIIRQIRNSVAGSSPMYQDFFKASGVDMEVIF